MERARELYERVIQNGERALDEFIETRASEELFLDFKRSSDNGDSRHLSQIDRNNLAKAISGFGNSSGGIVIWGVDCSADNDGADVAHAKKPINNVQRFLANLQGSVSGCTIPPHNGVEHRAIMIENERGYVVTYIPSSENAPHQAVGKLQYYIRAGSDFVPAPHQVLAGMFGRRPQPNVFHMITILPVKDEGHKLIFEYGIVVTNGGPGIARDLYFTAMIHEGLGKSTKIMWHPKDNNNWVVNFEFGRQISIISHESVRLPPKAFLTPLSLYIELCPPFNENLVLKGNIGCTGSPTLNIDIENSVAEVERLYEKYFLMKKTGDMPKDFGHQIAQSLLKFDK